MFVALVLLAGLLCAGTFAYAGPTEQPLGYQPTEQELKFVELLNQERLSRGLRPVELCAMLSEGCRRWSTRLLAGHWGHARNFEGGISENIARGFASAEGTFRQWRNSSGHYRNMMNPNITRIGIAGVGNAWTFRGGLPLRTPTATSGTAQTAQAPAIAPAITSATPNQQEIVATAVQPAHEYRAQTPHSNQVQPSHNHRLRTGPFGLFWW